MDIVDFLRPRFYLMENVVDILKFCGGILGRYALARGVGMNYQVQDRPMPYHSEFDRFVNVIKNLSGVYLICKSIFSRFATTATPEHIL